MFFICTRQIYVNSLRPGDAYMCQKTNHHGFRQWLVTWLAPSHYLNQCWNIVNWNLRNKLQWNLKQNSYIFIEKNACKSSVKWGQFKFCLGLNVLTGHIISPVHHAPWLTKFPSASPGMLPLIVWSDISLVQLGSHAQWSDIGSAGHMVLISQNGLAFPHGSTVKCVI